jgi:single-strand DNA-binding protein
MSYHTLVIVGHVGRDPEMRYTASGQAVTSFSLASSRKYTGANGQSVDETVWFRVSVWGKQAESTNQYLKKGSLVLVEGRLKPDTNGSPRVFTRQDGTTGSSYEVNASTVRFLSSKGDASSAAAGGEGGDAPGEEDAGDIPF